MTSDLTRTSAHATLEGSRRTVAGWVTTVAEYVGMPQKKSYDDAGFRRGRAMAFPRIPGENHLNPDMHQIIEQWTSGDPSRERSNTADTLQLPSPTHARPSRDNAILPELSDRTTTRSNPPAVIVTPEPGLSGRQNTHHTQIHDNEQRVGSGASQTNSVEAIMDLDEVEAFSEIEELVRRWTNVVI